MATGTTPFIHMHERANSQLISLQALTVGLHHKDIAGHAESVAEINLVGAGGGGKKKEHAKHGKTAKMGWGSAVGQGVDLAGFKSTRLNAPGYRPEESQYPMTKGTAEQPGRHGGRPSRTARRSRRG